MDDKAIAPSAPAPQPRKRMGGEKLSGHVTLRSYPPALIVFMKARADEGATNQDIMQEFGVSCNVATAIRKTTTFNKAHVSALKKGLPDAFASVVASSLSALKPEKLEACSAPQLMMVAGIGYDKFRLASGQSTQNISFRDAGSAAVDRAEAAEGMLKSIVASIDS